MTEDERVETWRADQLIKAGYPTDIALELAAALHVDLHQAVQLLTKGCPPATARTILV